MPYIWNPFTGDQDYFVETSGGPSDSAKEIKVTKLAAETISALKIVRAINNTEIIKADNNILVEDSEALGIATIGGNIGDTIDVLIFGLVEDPAFSAFSVGDELFLGNAGQIIASKPLPGVAKYLTYVGKALGNNSILLDIQPTIVLA